jgi:glucose/arabinose dehydrogenase
LSAARRRLAALVAVPLALAAALGAGPAGAQQAAVSLVPVARVAAPTALAAAPGDRSRLFVAQQPGRIVALRGAQTTKFLDLTDRVKADGYEQGLLGLAFAPDYATSGRFYVYYTAAPPAGAATKGGGADLVVSELRRRDADHGDPATERVLLRIPHRGDQYENGGQLRFGPDGRLWIGTGDGGGYQDPYRNAQRLDPATDDANAFADARLGKILRIDPAPGDGCDGRCTIPAGNPGFPQREVWAYGLRNPWRFAFDPAGGGLAIADVGNNTWEELDFAAGPDPGRGANFGWPAYEGPDVVAGQPAPLGTCCAPPVLAKSHDGDGYSALIGGVFVADPGLPALAGRFLYANLGSGAIRAVTLGAAGATDDRPVVTAAAGPTSFGEDGCGRVYVASVDGTIARLSQGAGACDAVGVTLTAPKRARLGGRGAGAVKATLACATACRASVRVSVRAGGVVLLGRTSARSLTLAAGRRASVTLRPSKALRARAARALARGRVVTAVVVAEARATGSTAHRRATATVRLTA